MMKSLLLGVARILTEAGQALEGAAMDWDGTKETVWEWFLEWSTTAACMAEEAGELAKGAGKELLRFSFLAMKEAFRALTCIFLALFAGLSAGFSGAKWMIREVIGAKDAMLASAVKAWAWREELIATAA